MFECDLASQMVKYCRSLHLRQLGHNMFSERESADKCIDTGTGRCGSNDVLRALTVASGGSVT